MNYTKKTAIRLASLAMFLTALVGMANAQPGKDKTSSTASTDAIHDVVAHTFKSECGGSLEEDFFRSINELRSGKDVDWNTSPLHKLVEEKFPNLFPKNSKAQAGGKKSQGPDPEAAYIFHVVKWKKSALPILISSDWHVYVTTGDGKLKESGFKGNGDPLIYGKKRAFVIGIDFLGSGVSVDINALATTYSTTATQGTPENQQNLGQLIAALLGISKSSSTAGIVEQSCGVFVSAGVQEGTKKLPFDLKVTAATAKPGGTEDAEAAAPPKDQGLQSQQNATPGVVNCSGDSNSLPCAVTRTFTSDAREWWDVSIGVTTPGVREDQFSINNNLLVRGATRHTDLYGLFDVFPAAAWLPKESWFPHFNVGIPVTSKSLYRPYFGLAENFTGWTHLQKSLNLPVGLNVFGGAIWMKTPRVTGNPTTPAQLTAATSNHRVWKGVIGIEVPVGSIASKIGKSGGSKNSNGSGKGGGGSGSN